jgi:HEAT repeat protein
VAGSRKGAEYRIMKNENEEIPFAIDKDANTNQEEIMPNFDELIKQFGNKETRLRHHLLYELIELKYPEIKYLHETALEDENEYVRIIAIQSIKDNMQVESIEKLIETFKETENRTIVSNLTRTFVTFQLGDPISAIVEKLNSKNEMIIYDCIWALDEIGNQSEIEILQEWTSNSNVPKLYDDEGILSQYTQFSIGEIAMKSIEKNREK